MFDSGTIAKPKVGQERETAPAAMRARSTVQDRAEILGAKEFLGVPVEKFEEGGREQLSYLQRAGATPSSKVVDLGCGVLRGGYWIIHFLNPGCYCGIEPHQERLRNGIQNILEPETLESKQPRLLSCWRFLSCSPGLPLRIWREPRQTAQSLKVASINRRLIRELKALGTLLSRISGRRSSMAQTRRLSDRLRSTHLRLLQICSRSAAEHPTQCLI